jgi:hypothetical protein
LSAVDGAELFSAPPPNDDAAAATEVAVAGLTSPDFGELAGAGALLVLAGADAAGVAFFFATAFFLLATAFFATFFFAAFFFVAAFFTVPVGFSAASLLSAVFPVSLLSSAMLTPPSASRIKVKY